MKEEDVVNLLAITEKRIRESLNEDIDDFHKALTEENESRISLNNTQTKRWEEQKEMHNDNLKLIKEQNKILKDIAKSLYRRS